MKVCLLGANFRNRFHPQEWSTCFMNYKLSSELKPGHICLSLLPQSFCWLFSHRILNYTISHQNHIHFLNHLKIALSSKKIWLRSSCTTLLGTRLGHAGFPMLIGRPCSGVCTENVFCGENYALEFSWLQFPVLGKGCLQLLCHSWFEQLCSDVSIVLELGDLGDDI